MYSFIMNMMFAVISASSVSTWVSGTNMVARPTESGFIYLYHVIPLNNADLIISVWSAWSIKTSTLSLVK